jgi:hypothetical protein
MTLFILVAVGFYFLPTIIGWQKRSAGGILALNFFLGWTVIGWIAAFIWALASDRPATHIVVYPVSSAPSDPSLYCPACGKYSPAGGAYCSKCGVRLAS